MKILVLNSGSSSIKFKLFDMSQKKSIVSGVIEEIGSEKSKAKIKISETKEIIDMNDETIKDHYEGILVMNELLKRSGAIKHFHELDGIGHRIVHGGEYFKHSCILNEESIKLIEKVSPLAPLHNPGHIAGILSAMEKNPNIPNVGVFDTVFHQSIPKYAYTYAIPYEFYEKYHVRRYGFHGTSHSYVSKKAAKFLGISLKKFNAISLHIGNGASICAIKGGKSIDTSMGISPLEGLIMGTRSGDIDPAAIEYISQRTGKSSSEIDSILNKKSGLYGICGSSDMREIQERIKNDDEFAKLAYRMYVYRIVKYIGAYHAILGRIDAIIFTAGIGENLAELRDYICKKISHLGIKLDINKNLKNNNKIRNISLEDSSIRALVVPTDEELAIALETKKLIEKERKC